MAQIALPRDVASAVIVHGIAMAQRAIVVVASVAMVPALLEAVSTRGGDLVAIVPAILSIVILAALAVLMLLRPTPFNAVVYIAVGFAASIVYVVAVLASDARLDEPGPFIVNRLATGLVMIGALRGSARSGLLWSLAGFVAAEASLAIGFSIAGRPVEGGYSPLIVVALSIVAYSVLALGRHRARLRMPDLDRLQLELELADRQRELERRAALVVHDTVLADLTIVASRPGDLDDGARARLEHDLALAAAGSVARTPPLDEERPRAPIADDLLALAEEYRWSGVTVDVSGWETLDDALAPEVSTAVLGAARAALDNVVRHARTDRAELVVGSRDGRLAVLVVDDGVGFATESVDPARWGVRSSIHERIREVGGSVRVWSGDEGTTVMLTVPVIGARTDDEPGVPRRARAGRGSA